jgi:hypothetical protein
LCTCISKGKTQKRKEEGEEEEEEEEAKKIARSNSKRTSV